MIEVKNLTKSYGDFVAVNDISFKVSPGEIIGLLGPNGAGKTTTMKILTGYLKPTNGEVFINGKNIKDNLIETKKLIGYLPETNPLYEDLNVLEYLEFAAEMNDVPFLEKKQQIKRVIEICNLKEKMRQDIKELSRGYAQRVGLAQSLIHDPKILILDEPTTGLDPNQRIEIRELIKKIGKEKTIILSSHILPEVEATCDRVLIINKGKIVASGTPTELKNKLKKQTKITLEIEGPEDQIVAKISPISGVIKIIKSENLGNITKLILETDSNLDLRKKIIEVINENHWTLLEISKQESSLEDIFVSLTNE